MIAAAVVLEAALVGIPLVAAIVYLVVELLDLKVWWNRRRNPERPERPPSLGDTWPSERRTEAEDTWRKMLDGEGR